jgi:hypothetical protein
MISFFNYALIYLFYIHLPPLTALSDLKIELIHLHELQSSHITS